VLKFSYVLVVKELKSPLAGRIISIIIGVALFAVFYALMPTGVLYALLIGLAAWVMLTLIFSKKERDSSVVADGMTRLEIDNTIRAGKKLTIAMRNASYRLMQMDVRKQIEDLCKIAESMFEMLKKDPNDIRVVKQFITYYLEPTHKIILKYVDLATARPMPADAIEILDRTEKSLPGIRSTFLQQKEKMLANDVMDLDTEIKVFETISGNKPIGGGSTQDKNKSSVSSSGK
jgi:5-bromo-4-chloroindolyl phosphate hydrolysis protein